MGTGSSKIAYCLLFSVIHLIIDLFFHFYEIINYSLTFEFGPQYVAPKIYCDPFSHVMNRCQYKRQLQQQRISFNTRSMLNSLY